MVELSRDRIAGLSFILLGLGFAFGAGAYRMGQLEHMGPGYFPRLLGILLTVLGILIVACAKNDSSESGTGIAIPWRPLLAVGAAVAFFGLLLNVLGLGLASFGLVVIAGFGQTTRRWKELLTSAVILSLASIMVFAWGLRLPLPLWPVWL